MIWRGSENHKAWSSHFPSKTLSRPWRRFLVETPKSTLSLQPVFLCVDNYNEWQKFKRMMSKTRPGTKLPQNEYTYVWKRTVFMKIIHEIWKFLYMEHLHWPFSPYFIHVNNSWNITNNTKHLLLLLEALLIFIHK